MKKSLFTFALAFLCNFSFGQTIHKGSMLGLHILAPKLKDGVTVQDFANFYMSKVIPEIEKAVPEEKVFILKSLRGQDSSNLGILFIYNSEADRNKYWNKDGTATAAQQAVFKKLNEKFGKEMDIYITTSEAEDKYNDWVVQ